MKMKVFIRDICITYVFPVIVAAFMLAVASSYKSIESDGSSNTAFELCFHQYALCTAAKCVPLPGNPTQAICSCVVEEGPSAATVPCNTLRPFTDSFDIRTIFSTFSFAEFEKGKKALHCPDGTPWVNCLNKQCTVDPSNPHKALCICDILRSGRWFTAGGRCDRSTCATNYWSGALIQDLKPSSAFLVKALGLKKSPIKSCPHRHKDSS